MAFNVPIEADQPGDLGFFSTFVTAPITGTLMWILRGEDSKEHDDGETEPELSLDACSHESKENKNYLPNETANETRSKIHHHNISQHFSSATESLPDTSESDISSTDGEGDCSYSADDWGIRTYQKHSDKTVLPSHHQKNEFIRHSFRSIRKTSWSDESGQSLVKYLDETTIHEPPSAAIPVKSAMRRSKSAHTNVRNGSVQDLGDISRNNCNNSTQQYIPSGITSTGGGIVMPSGGGSKTSLGENGYVSPQWGWYISTTPPTLEKYPTSKSSFSSLKPAEQPSKEPQILFECQASPAANESVGPLTHRVLAKTPIFTKGVKGIGRTHMDWSGIPL